MRTIEVKLYQFDELPTDKAKERARDWFREGYDFDANFEPAETAAKLLGITFGTTEVKLMSGKSRYDSDIRYSGFYTQGSGLCFVGSYEYAKGSSKAVRREFGKDEKLWAIADGLTALQRKHGYKLRSTITQYGNYYHMDVVTIIDTAAQNEADEETAKELTELFQDFAKWIYDGLQEDYEYLTSDEAVDESIKANEYEFYEDGRRARE